ncbi:MAG: sigma-54 dependent transcriptional regulator [Proteobacteria bacterium]|nr:sigma-54 dependent transcriptional regulator [Pseudomonadota bacterium]MBU1610379.1 sigma-54 dependent transcriptional regulator [Pseudomonadota bacterium]
MWKDKKVTVLVAGSGKTCGPFLAAVGKVRGIRIAGLLDIDRNPSSLILAQKLNLPLLGGLTDCPDMDTVNILVDTTGRVAVAEHIKTHCPADIPVYNGAGARLIRILALAIRTGERYRERYIATRREIEQRAEVEDRIIGKSPEMTEVNELIKRVAPTPTTVLLLGETGVGKDLVARNIHRTSPLKHRPFISVNCTALTSTLMESELFGYRKGAFTGAEADRKGLFEEADGGTLFLDEIGDMREELQAKLLRFLQTGEVRRVGCTEIRNVKVRVIAATNRDLEQAVERGEFRRDLFYRFNTFTITLPALRQRRSDIPYLAYHFITKAEAKLNMKIKGIDNAALDRMSRYDWPGNVRELENVIERAAILCSDEVIRVQDLAIRINESACDSLPLPTSGGQSCLVSNQEDDQYSARRGRIMDNFEKKELLRYLQLAEGNVSEAARLSGIPRRTLYRKMKKFGI